MKYLVQFTMKQLLELGVVHCTCGHPPNNHFLDQDDHPCAHCKCKKLKPYISYGKIVMDEPENLLEKAMVKDCIKHFRDGRHCV